MNKEYIEMRIRILKEELESQLWPEKTECFIKGKIEAFQEILRMLTQRSELSPNVQWFS